MTQDYDLKRLPSIHETLPKRKQKEQDLCCRMNPELRVKKIQVLSLQTVEQSLPLNPEGVSSYAEWEDDVPYSMCAEL